MSVELFIKGILVGFFMAAPLGPMGVLCVKRVLSYGWRSGMVTGLGIATIDALYGSTAVLGVVFIIAFVLKHALIIQLLGIFVLLYLSASVYLEKPQKLSLKNDTPESLLSDYTSAAMLTLCNPVTILSFMGALAALNIAESFKHEGALSLVGGIFLGSLFWWLILSAALGSVRHALTRRQLTALNKIAGSIIFFFALALAVRVIVTIT